jgi:hypothetical protein
LQNLEVGVSMLIDQELNEVDVVPVSIYRDSTEQTYETLQSYKDVLMMTRNLPKHYFGKIFLQFHQPIKLIEVNNLRNMDFVYEPITLVQVVQAAIGALNNSRPAA